MRETIPATLAGYSDRPTMATVTVDQFDRRRRLRRAFQGLAIAWGAAAASAFIPIAHFLLVPGLLLFGLYLFVHRFGTQVMAHGATGVCPDCGADQSFELPSKWHPPHDVTCGTCRRGLVLRGAVSPAARQL